MPSGVVGRKSHMVTHLATIKRQRLHDFTYTCKMEGLGKRKGEGGGQYFLIKASDWEILESNLFMKYLGKEHAWGFVTSHLQLIPKPKKPNYVTNFYVLYG